MLTFLTTDQVLYHPAAGKKKRRGGRGKHKKTAGFQFHEDYHQAKFAGLLEDIDRIAYGFCSKAYPWLSRVLQEARMTLLATTEAIKESRAPSARAVAHSLLSCKSASSVKMWRKRHQESINSRAISQPVISLHSPTTRQHITYPAIKTMM